MSPEPGYGRFTFEPFRSRRPDLFTVECANCGSTVDEGSAWPCQGCDTCEAKLCDGCRSVCEACGLTSCSEHLVDYGGEQWCHLCFAAEMAEAREETEAA